MIPNRTVEEIFQRARIEEVVGDFLTLKKRGVNFLGNCPFHNEKTPSFTVSPAKNIFKCFGCGKSGTSVGFIMEHEHMSYVEALRYLAAKYNVPIEEVERTPEQDEAARKRESLLVINQFAAKYFQSNLLEKDYGRSIGLSYFKERGFNESTIKEFQLGYAFPDGHDFVNSAKAEAYNEDLLTEVGLVSKTGRDFFTNRVMFPILSLAGRVLGFGGRALTTNEKTPKYLNSPESEIYNKSKILFGFYQAKNAIRKEDNCFLVEGYTDVIALHQAGIQIAVATSGTALTRDQAQLIKRFTDNVTLLFDGDPAGIKAAQRGIDILLSQNLNVHIAILPDNNDPDSYIKAHGSTALTNFVETNKKDFILFKISEVADAAKNDPIKKVALLQDIIQSIAQIPDSLKRNIYASTCAGLLDVREELILVELSKVLKKRIEQERLEEIRDQRIEARNKMETGQASTEQEAAIAPKSGNLPFQTLLKILLLHGEQAFDEENGISVKTYIASSIQDDKEYMDHPLYFTIYEEYINRDDKGLTNYIEYYLNHANDDIRNLVINWVDPGFEMSKNWEERYHQPLQYQKPPNENFINELNQAMLLFKLQVNTSIMEENKRRIEAYSLEGNEDQLIIQLTTQSIILKERAELSRKIGLVVIPK